MANDGTITKADLVNQTDEITSVITELSSQVDQQFRQVDKRFEQVDRRFEQVDKRFDELSKHISSNRADIRRILGSLDNIEKQLETDGQERLVASYQVKQLHDWAVEVGEKIGIEFKPH